MKIFCWGGRRDYIRAYGNRRSWNQCYNNREICTRWGIDIVSGKNDILEITVDGVKKSIILDSKEYSKEELIDEINTKLGDINAIAEILEHPNNGKYALSIINKDVGKGTISISPNCNAYKSLFSEAYTITPPKMREEQLLGLKRE